MNAKATLAVTLALQALAACSAATAPDRCVTIDIGEAAYQHSPKYEICLPDKAIYKRPDVSQNSIGVLNGYEGNWMTSGVYEISVYRDSFDSKRNIEQVQQEFISLMGMREIATGSRKIYYRPKNRIFDKLPEEAKKESFGISVFEARGDGRIVSIEAAVKKPKDYDKDPVGAMDRLVQKDVNALLGHIKVFDTPAKKES